MELLGSDVPAAERRVGIRVVTSMVVRVKLGDAQAGGRVADVGAGAPTSRPSYVATSATPWMWRSSASRAPRARLPPARPGRLARRAEGKRRGGLGICFGAPTEADERRLRRFVLDVLREHVPRSHD